MKPYLPTLGVVLLCIIANAVAQTTGSRSSAHWWTAISCLWCGMALRIFLPCGISQQACLHLCGGHDLVLPVHVPDGQGQPGTQKHIRDEMFAHMQTLPLRYFDTNTAGNIMSRYTSDIDTLRQMISQSIPSAHPPW